MSFQVSPGNGHQRPAVLLVDAHTAKRLLRSTILTRLGMQVTCVEVGEAVNRSKQSAYRLVLVGLQHDPAAALALGQEIRAGRPGQRVAYLVGKPLFLADAPDFAGELAGTVPLPPGESYEHFLAQACQPSRLGQGILEAAWKIASLRALKDPRAQVTPGALPEAHRRLGFGEAIRVAGILEGVPV